MDEQQFRELIGTDRRLKFNRQPGNGGEGGFVYTVLSFICETVGGKVRTHDGYRIGEIRTGAFGQVIPSKKFVEMFPQFRTIKIIRTPTGLVFEESQTPIIAVGEDGDSSLAAGRAIKAAAHAKQTSKSGNAKIERKPRGKNQTVKKTETKAKADTVSESKAAPKPAAPKPAAAKSTATKEAPKAAAEKTTAAKSTASKAAPKATAAKSTATKAAPKAAAKTTAAKAAPKTALQRQLPLRQLQRLPLQRQLPLRQLQRPPLQLQLQLRLLQRPLQRAQQLSQLQRLLPRPLLLRQLLARLLLRALQARLLLQRRAPLRVLQLRW